MEAELDEVVGAIRQALKSGKGDPKEWSGRCFSAVNAASQTLIMMGQPHQIIVGNIYVNGRAYYSTTAESVAAELAAGFDQHHPANAHPWIEFRDGTLLDPCFRATMAKKLGRRIKWNELIQIGTPTSAWLGHSMRYVAFLRGLDYYRKVVTPSNDDGPFHAMTKMHGEHWQASLDELNGATV